ncbi:hypothetical protein F4604DRAFT_1919574 [Suillus subluteus]|nr:hypothetical protein F4604DRAFT_1919574 [Suillus subluteus]
MPFSQASPPKLAPSKFETKVKFPFKKKTNGPDAPGPSTQRISPMMDRRHPLVYERSEDDERRIWEDDQCNGRPRPHYTNFARGVVLKYLIIGLLPIVEKATVVPLPGTFHGTLIGLFMTPIFQHEIYMMVVSTEGNAIFLHYHLIHLTAPVPGPPPLLHTEESTDCPHIALQQSIIVHLIVTVAWTDYMTKGCVMGVGNTPVIMTIIAGGMHYAFGASIESQKIRDAPPRTDIVESKGVWKISAALQGHSDRHARLGDELQVHREKNETLSKDLDDVCLERDNAQLEVQSLESRVKELIDALSIPTDPPVQYTGEATDIIAILQPIWNILPAPELRALKLNNHHHHHPNPPFLTWTYAMSARNLLLLLLPATSPPPPDQRKGTVSVEAFVSHVQALVIHDRALIERLIWFAQVHDLLKKNAEHAQKLTQDSNTALEMYQQQVAMLERQNTSLLSKQNAFSFQPTSSPAHRRVLAFLLRPENNCYTCIPPDQKVSHFIDALITQTPEVRVLLDVGAQMLELKNQELACVVPLFPAA